MPGEPSITESSQVLTMADTPVFGRGQSQRLLTGYLEHILDNRASKRFAVLERDLDSDEVQLKLYRDRTETALRKTYTFTKTNFVGTERGSVKRNSKYPVLYWAIILTTETVLFQDACATHSSSDFERWNDLMKELWRHQSWMVRPVYGITQSTENEFVLHLNKVSLGLAHVNPPRNFLRWDIEEIQEATSKGKRFMFAVMSSTGNSGYYELRTDKERQAARIQDAFVMQTWDIPTMGEFTPSNEGRRYTGESNDGSVQPPSPSGSIDPTTGEVTHMSIEELQGTHQGPLLTTPQWQSHLPLETTKKKQTIQTAPVRAPTQVPPNATKNNSVPQTAPLRAPTHLPLEVAAKKNATPPSPSSSQGSPVANKPRKRFFQGPRLITGQRWKMPELPPRTTSCVMGETSPPVTKVLSKSMGNLRDTSPTLFNGNRLSGYSSGNNSPDIPMSAKHLPLPNLPPGFQGRKSPLLQHPKPPSIDENSVYAGSNSSIASQDVSPTPSMSSMSLSDEEPRYPLNNGQQSSPKVHTRSSSEGFNNYSNREALYQRSMLVPEEKPPSLVGHMICSHSYYINIPEGPLDPVYINVSKKEALYENPPIFHPEYEPQNMLPLPPRKLRLAQKGLQSLQDTIQRATEVSDILNDILNSGRQLKGSDLGMSYCTFQKLCFSMDVDIITAEPNNWRGLASSIGIEKVTDIQMIDSFSSRHSKSPTDIVLYYWHCQANPPYPHSMEQLKIILGNMGRQDILGILGKPS